MGTSNLGRESQFPFPPAWSSLPQFTVADRCKRASNHLQCIICQPWLPVSMFRPHRAAYVLQLPFISRHQYGRIRAEAVSLAILREHCDRLDTRVLRGPGRVQYKYRQTGRSTVQEIAIYVFPWESLQWKHFGIGSRWKHAPCSDRNGPARRSYPHRS
ncbi:hypothetical protein FKP32DRAFT_948426 [Trametes sanguinea]|nr:hypothetical protein FKP32DRAFT_948426 [Trametes sanguinea]